MSLAHEARRLTQDREGAAPAMVIAIAASADERARLARALEGITLLLVSSAEEARALLSVSGPGVSLPGEPPVVLPGPRRPLAAVGVPDPSEVRVDSDLRTVAYDGRSVALSPLEHDLLRCLLTDPGHTWAFARLHRTVWGNDHLGGSGDLQSVVKRLRHKLARIDSPLRIRSVRGVGLRLEQV